MTTTTPTQRYSAASIGMHWLMVLAFIGIYVAVNLIDVFPKGSDSRQWAKNMHFSLGLLVFGLVWVRLVFRLLGSTPPIVPAPPAWQEKLAKLLHLALYALMLAMPLLGWAALSAFGKPIPLFALALPALLAENKELGRSIMEVHELGGNLGYLLIGGHALAALLHHYLIKDNTLRRMWIA
jgi:superoxide oxidase